MRKRKWRKWVKKITEKATMYGYDKYPYIILQRGTVIKFEGVPCELLEDTAIYSKTLN